MPFEFTHPWWLIATLVALGWVVWLSLRSDSSLVGPRRWVALGLRLVVVALLGLALAGLRYRLPIEGMNVFFALDRSDSIPGEQQELSREWVNTLSARKKADDRGGVVVFGADAAIESAANVAVDLPRVQAVISASGTDLAGAIRLATAAFPETGQRRVVVASDGHQTLGDAVQAAVAARALGVTIDALPLGAERGRDVLVQKVAVPNQLKKGQPFEVKIFVESDRATRANVSLYRQDQLLGTQPVELQAGKNLFTFPQTLDAPGFYSYDVRIDAPGDAVAQNNRSTSYTNVRGEPRVLIISSDPAADRPLGEALVAAKLEARVVDLAGFPSSLPEMQSYDAIFLSNISAGDLSADLMRLLESAVRDFGVGLVALGGDQAFAAGGYRGTPLENALPVDMELSSKKVLPKGALVLVVHATEFPNGNQWARDIAFAALQALGPQDEMGIVFWDGSERWLYELAPVGDRRAMGRAIMGMNPGDMTTFHGAMSVANDALRRSTANLKHMVVFSDGDPGAPSDELLKSISGNRITISTVMIGGHVEPSLMIEMAEKGRGRFYDVTSPAQLPQIFVKEAAVILKSAINEEPFRPQVAGGSEITRGIAASDYPTLRGYVATSPKARAETPLVTGKGDPLLAHWQFGLGRAVAFTSDARAKWGADWVTWSRYRQFWSQVAQWALRKVDATDFTTDVTLDDGVGHMSVEALDGEGNFRNFLNLQAVVVDAKGQRQNVRLSQKGPGRYEAEFPAKEVGAYMINLLDIHEGEVRSVQPLGANLNYSPEFSVSGPNLAFLQRLVEAGGGRVLDAGNPLDNPYLRDRRRTHQPRDLWWWLLAVAVVLFPIDVGVRRVQIDPAEWAKAWAWLLHALRLRRRPTVVASDPALSTLLARKDQVRATQTGAATTARPADELFRPAQRVEVRDDPLPSGQPNATTEPKVEPANPEGTSAEVSGTERLLAAKRRAQNRKKP
ncbi:MAG: VWA domain-containing protein [Verrucomicrobiales bacterium]|nr:VWA domain-containing protein [Verrucomicrobiales bacterium]